MIVDILVNGLKALFLPMIFNLTLLHWVLAFIHFV